MIRTVITRRAAGEEGWALVASLSLLLVMMGIALAGFTTAAPSLHQENRGRNDILALQGADAVANFGWGRINYVQPSFSPSSSTPCMSWSSGGTVTAVASSSTSGSIYWCPSTSVSLPNVNSASYQVGVSTTNPYQPQYLVGTATVNGVTRRIKLALNAASTATSLFGNFAVESESSLDFQNGSQVTGGPVWSDANVTLEDTQVPCHVPNGTVYYGKNGGTITTTNGAGTCGYTPTQATTTIPWQTISAPGSDNDSGIAAAVGSDTVHFSWSYSSTNRSLTISNNGDLKLTGNTYTFCNLDIKDGTLELAPSNGKAVQIYMLDPASSACSGAGFSSTSRVFNLENSDSWIENETSLGAAGVQVYLLGTTANTTPGGEAFLNNDSSHQFKGVIYGNSIRRASTDVEVTVINQAAMKGAIAAYSMQWTASASLAYDSSASGVTYSSGGATTYTQSQYRECTPTAGSGSAPDNGC